MGSEMCIRDSLFIGWGFASVYLQTFWRCFPERVCGLILIDPVVPDMLEVSFSSHTGFQSGWLSRILSTAGEKAEIQGRQKSIFEMDSSGKTPHLPLTVITTSVHLNGSNYPYKLDKRSRHDWLSKINPLGIHITTDLAANSEAFETLLLSEISRHLDEY